MPRRMMCYASMMDSQSIASQGALLFPAKVLREQH